VVIDSLLIQPYLIYVVKVDFSNQQSNQYRVYDQNNFLTHTYKKICSLDILPTDLPALLRKALQAGLQGNKLFKVLEQI